MDLELLIRRIRSPAGPADLSQVRAFEHALGATLPEDYRGFLLAVNGGFPAGWVGVVEPPTGGFPLAVLGGIRPDPALSLLAALAAEPNAGPAPWVWIGGDGAHNDLLLALRDARRGAVLHRDRRRPSAEPTEIAPSFSALIAALWPTRGPG